MNTSYPDDKKEQLRFENTYGKYLMSAYNTWHGGVHLEGKNNKIHAIADGKIIAYRLNEEYEELTKTKSKTAEEEENEAITVKGYKYSNSFILIQHDLELALERPKEETEEQTGNGEKKLVTFYSLYNHLKPINDIDNDKLDFPEFLGKKQTTVKLKEGFGKPITRKGLNATTIVGNTKIVIPKGKIVTKYFNEDGKEEKAYNHKKEEFVRIIFLDDDATEYNDLFISTASTYIKDLGSSYQIISQVNEEKWEDKSGLTEDQKKAKPGARVRNATSGGTITAIIPFGETVSIEETIIDWHVIKNYSGYSHKTNFETKNCLDESKFTKNEIVACNIPIKANTHIGYAGLLESDSSVGYNACQLDVFMTEGVEDFIKNKFEVDGNDKPFEAGINDKHFYKLSAGTKLLKSIKTTVDLQQNLPVKILEIRGSFAKIKVVDKIVRTVVVEGNIYTSDNDKGKYKGYNNIRGYHILNFFCVNQKFDGLLVENESVLVYDSKPKKGDLTRELKFVPKEAGKEFWVHVKDICPVKKVEKHTVVMKVPVTVSNSDTIMDYFSSDKLFKEVTTELERHIVTVAKGDKTKLTKQICEAYLVIPKNKNDVDEELCHDSIIDLRKFKNRNIKDYIQVECIHLLGKKPFTQKGWIKKPTDLAKNAFSAYNWDKFGFKTFDAGNEYIYDIKGLHNFIRTDSLFISELWSKLDVTKNKNKDLIDINELRLAYSTLETQEAISKMVCKHTLEWAYTPNQISEEVSKIYDYYISLEDPSVEGELKELKKQKLQGLEEQVEKMMFWEELKTKVYTPPEPEPEIKERPEQVALELKALGIIDYPYKLTTANDPILNVAPVDPVENDIHAPTPDPVETVEPIETPVEEQVKAPERLMPDTNHVYHFHPIAFVNHMKLIYGMGGADNNSEAKIRAFLRVIKQFEGIPGENGYTTLFGGKQFSDMSKHPEDPQEWYTKADGTKIYSSAAGSYQIMQFLWWEYNGWVVKKKDGKYYKTGDRNENKNYAKTYEIKDFSPKSQDEYCIAILLHQSKSAKLLEYLLNGFVTRAIEQCAAYTWASFTPGRFPKQGPAKGLTDPKKIKDAIHDARVKQWEAYNKYLTEELAGQSDLHLEPGFLKKFGIKEPKTQELIENKKKGLDLNKAIERLNKRAGANDTSVWKCAKYVRWALEAGGMKTWGVAKIDQRPNSAKDYGPFLLHKGFKEVPDGNYQIGDISVIQNLSAEKPHGHIAMWNGENWVSDFVQSTLYPGDAYRKAEPNYKIYRWE
ncbi:glycoside hydrolase family 104 protein [Cellulophaga baltica]|uniref:glycoside hydrolase family 24 protein n=1 Tax=Cellulophaga baltica TaxID=76594 RepID=UPI002147C138|nr:glycoside hydrolase family 104 protein [Cellulophaga baltica]MCR1024162.1 glycoside hydrolase family 104 protein [Cellulophaga baltica]